MPIRNVLTGRRGVLPPLISQLGGAGVNLWSHLTIMTSWCSYSLLERMRWRKTKVQESRFNSSICRGCLNLDDFVGQHPIMIVWFRPGLAGGWRKEEVLIEPRMGSKSGEFSSLNLGLYRKYGRAQALKRLRLAEGISMREQSLTLPSRHCF